MRDRLGLLTRVTPDVFAIVMATGIVAVAAKRHGHPLFGAITGWVATVFFVALIGAAAVKISTRRHVVRAELEDPGSVFGMFTFVAAACVLSVVWEDRDLLVALLGLAAVAAWVVFLLIGVRAVVRTPGRIFRERARGGWLLVSVATSGLVIVVARAAVDHRRPGLITVASVLWILGVMAYLIIAALVVWRVTTVQHPAEVATPDGWILMGALAIATLAAATIHDATGTLPELVGRQGLAGGVDLATWVAASAWIPVLAAIHLWVVVRDSRRLEFANPWWSAVFPVGMYCSASAAVGSQMDLPVIGTISAVAFWGACVAWGLTTAAMLRAAFRWVRTVPSRSGPTGPPRDARTGSEDTPERT